MQRVALGFTGCKINNYEIQALSEALELLGMKIVPFGEKADCYIINTCTVTSKADTTSRNLIRRARRISPDSVIAVTGCYAQLKPEDIRKIGIDLLIPNSRKDEIPARLYDMLSGHGGSPAMDNIPEYGSFIISKMRGLTRGFIKIQEGCDRSCTYCTIWMSRGELRSRDPRYIVDEINSLHRNGYLEVVLTGVHIGKYRFGDHNFPDLLEKILADTQIPRIRLSSMYPTEINDRLLEILLNPRLCPHIHLSIQSGDDTVLERMGRDYTRADLDRIIGLLNERIPEITVGGDIITGFPGETEEQFENSYDFVENSGIHHLHVFSFSARPGTQAAKMKEMVEPEVKRKRTNRLRRLGVRKKDEHMSGFINKELQVLFENRAPGNNGFLTGLSGNYLRVNAAGDSSLRGKVVKVRPYSVENSVLIAHIP